MDKITLYLMSQKGFDVLKAILDGGYKDLIEQVIVGKDNSVENDYSQEIENLCVRHKIENFERTDHFKVSSLYSLAISWRWLIKESNSKLIILHDSLLPKYRGFAPLVNMLINEEKSIGVTALFANEEYDRGSIIAQSSSDIAYPIKISEAINIISKNYIELVLTILEKIKTKQDIKSLPQNENLATYSLWRDEEDYLIDWNLDSHTIENFINAVGVPYSGASTYINKEKCRVLDVEQYPDVEIVNRTSGKLIFTRNTFPVIVCGTGLLVLKKVIIDESGENGLPFTSFRTRLKSFL